MPYNAYLQVTEDRYNLLCGRFSNYMAHIDDVDTEPIKLFDPLSPKLIKELELIREVSKELQNKKDEDMKKAADAAAEAERIAKEKKESETKAAEENGDGNEKQEEKENESK